MSRSVQPASTRQASTASWYAALQDSVRLVPRGAVLGLLGFLGIVLPMALLFVGGLEFAAIYIGPTLLFVGWFAILRMYGPLQPWIDKTWRPGEIEGID